MIRAKPIILSRALLSNAFLSESTRFAFLFLVCVVPPTAMRDYHFLANVGVGMVAHFRAGVAISGIGGTEILVDCRRQEMPAQAPGEGVWNIIEAKLREPA